MRPPRGVSSHLFRCLVGLSGTSTRFEAVVLKAAWITILHQDGISDHVDNRFFLEKQIVFRVEVCNPPQKKLIIQMLQTSSFTSTFKWLYWWPQKPQGKDVIRNHPSWKLGIFFHKFSYMAKEIRTKSQAKFMTCQNRTLNGKL